MQCCVAALAGVLFLGEFLAAFGDEAGWRISDSSPALLEDARPFVDKVVFVGLRHIAAEAVLAQIASHAGTRLDAQRVSADVKALGRIGWFGDVAVETQPAEESRLVDNSPRQRVRLVFHVTEFPNLVSVEYSGSRLLSASQIERILREKQAAPRLGAPADPSALFRTASSIHLALEELGHPQASIRVSRDESANGTVRVRYEISDGPHVPVGRVDFMGHPEVSAKVLRHEMQRTSPGALFASWRSRGAYTREGLAEDRAKLLIYYQDHGYPEARIGAVHVAEYEEVARRWIPWPSRKTEKRLAVTVPIEAGPLYRVESVRISPELVDASGKRGAKMLAYSKREAGSVYSAKALEELRHAWVAAIQTKRDREQSEANRSVETSRTLDPQTHLVGERIRFSDGPPYIVRRIEFLGDRRFSDRYLRRRIGLREGEAFDEHALEVGLARLARTNYFHQIQKEDVQVRTDDVAHAADVTIRVSEAGRQRASFSGGLGQFGSTVGMAYTLFDMLQREELLSAQIDGGPQNLELVMGLVLEGLLGSRSSLAISVFDNFLRPRFASSVKGPFYKSQSEGLNTGWSYPLTSTDVLAVNYSFSRTFTDYSFVLPASLAGLPSTDLSAKTSSSAMGLTWTHDAGNERVLVNNSISGGWLGGTENVVRSNEEYSRIFSDPIFNHHNAWAFRTTFSGAGSYQGDMPLAARLSSGDAQVRGLESGELGPYEVIPTLSGSGNQSYTATPAGANVISAANAEYRFPVGKGTQVVGFFDLGSGWMLPNWLGPTRPTLLTATNGVLHGSVGIELRWTVPEVQVPVRAYFAVNVLRLNRFLPLPDGTLFHAHSRLFSLGWALGTLF